MNLRIIIADDERPARLFLKSLVESFEDAEIVGEAENGAEAIEIIEKVKPDLALLDLQMPEVGGLEVVKLLSKSALPLVAFVTAYDEFAVRAFELNAVDYLLKPVEKKRLGETLVRARERLEQTDFRQLEASKLNAVSQAYETSALPIYAERIPVRRRDEIILLPVGEIVSIVADGELLHIVTLKNECHTINFRLKDLEIKLNPSKFVRLSRGAIVSLEMIAKISPLPGGTYTVTLANGRELSTSRQQSRILREQLLKL